MNIDCIRRSVLFEGIKLSPVLGLPGNNLRLFYIIIFRWLYKSTVVMLLDLHNNDFSKDYIVDDIEVFNVLCMRLS